MLILVDVIQGNLGRCHEPIMPLGIYYGARDGAQKSNFHDLLQAHLEEMEHIHPIEGVIWEEGESLNQILGGKVVIQVMCDRVIAGVVCELEYIEAVAGSITVLVEGYL